MNRQELDDLHEKASGLYLQGDHQGALAAWQLLLEKQPDDERALEGIRLCEQLAGGTEESVCTPGQSPFAVGIDPATVVAAPPMAATMAAGPAQGPSGTVEPSDPDVPGQDLQDALDELDAQLDLGVIDSPDIIAKEQSAESGDGGFLDLSDLAEEEESSSFESLTEAAPPEPAAAAKDDSSTWTWGGEPEEDGPNEAVLELRRRVNEMLANALVAYEGGRKTQALKILDRLLAVDEDNQPARELRNKVAREIEGDAPAQPADEFDPVESEPAQAPIPAASKLETAPVGLGEPLELADLQDGPGGNPPLDLLEPLDTLDSPDSPADSDDDWPQENDEHSGPAEDKAMGAEPEIAEAASAPAAKSRKGLLIVLGIVLLAAAGWQGWTMFNAPASESTPEPAATPALDEFLQGQNPESTPKPVEVPPPVEPALPDVSGVLDSAHKAFTDGNYSLAVIRYGEAVKLDPTNTDARRRLRVAGERYRERKEIETQWERVFTSFQGADYGNALRILYRLPETEDPQRIAAMKTAAWYNLGLDRLKAADCAGARTNFKEARALSPKDVGVAEGLRMARMCADSPTPAFAKTVASMAPRGPVR